MAMGFFTSNVSIEYRNTYSLVYTREALDGSSYRDYIPLDDVLEFIRTGALIYTAPAIMRDVIDTFIDIDRFVIKLFDEGIDDEVQHT